MRISVHLAIGWFALLVSASVVSSIATAADAPAGKAVPLLTAPLANLNGKEVTMLTVEYPPGGASPSHRHDAYVYVYVLEGAIVMKTQSGPEVTLTAGQTFTESPTDIHTVSRNASNTHSAKFLVFMIKDVGAPPTRAP